MLRAEHQSARMSKITNYQLNPVWHRMLKSCTHMATVDAKRFVSTDYVFFWRGCLQLTDISRVCSDEWDILRCVSSVVRWSSADKVDSRFSFFRRVSEIIFMSFLTDWLSKVRRQCFTGLMTQPTVSKHRRMVVSHPDRPQSNHAHLNVLQ